MRPAREPTGAWLVGLLLVVGLATSCATRGAPWTAASAAEAPSLLARAEMEEQALAAHVPAYEDPLLDEYLATIGDRLLSDDERAVGRPGVSFVVLRDPSITAFAMPTGRVYLHAGLLSRVENEAQLAMVLAREMSRRHTVDGQVGDADIARAIIRIPASIAPAMTAPVGLPGDEGGAILSPTAHAILGETLTVAYVAAFTGHGRDLERDADAAALARLVKAGYDPKEAPKVFERLRREARSGGVMERFFLGSEPALADRIVTASRLVEETYAVAAALTDTVKNTEEFEGRLATVVRENAHLEIRAGRFRAAQEQLDRVLGLAPRDALAHLYYGDLYRLRSQRARSIADRDDLAGRALASYERCLTLDATVADALRQLGLLYYQLRQDDKAREAFGRYASLRPEPPGAARVREYLAVLGR